MIRAPESRATEAGALAAARRAAPPNTRVSARQDADGRWMPVVLLRPDQTWLRAHVEERGALAEDLG